MDYETALKVENGEMPDDYYRVANDERELAAIIEDWKDGSTIRKDALRGYGFHFGQTVGGRYVFMSDEFLDADEERDNPDFHESRYDTAIEGVRNFKIQGHSLMYAVRGRRIAQSDAPEAYPD